MNTVTCHISFNTQSMWFKGFFWQFRPQHEIDIDKLSDCLYDKLHSIEFVCVVNKTKHEIRVNITSSYNCIHYFICPIRTSFIPNGMRFFNRKVCGFYIELTFRWFFESLYWSLFQCTSFLFCQRRKGFGWELGLKQGSFVVWYVVLTLMIF